MPIYLHHPFYLLKQLSKLLVACWVCLLLSIPMFISPSIAAEKASSSSFLDFGDEQEILPPDEAFKLTVISQGAQALEAYFEIAPNHYLYKDRIQFEIEGKPPVKLSPTLPKGDIKDDPNFGKMEVFHQSFTSLIALPSSLAQSIRVKASYQGCSEKGLCYAPIKKTFDVALPANTESTAKQLPSPQTSPDEHNDEATTLLKSGKLWLIIAGFFGFGLLLSLTPCVLPMIPILSGIIVGGQHVGRMHTFNLSLAYTLGMALSYTLAGIAAAYSGQLISNTLQNPWALGFGAFVFVLLALSMFGFYELKLPDSLENSMIKMSNRMKGGRFAGVFVMGALSALIVSPCVAAPLAGALLYISQSHDVVLGGVALFSLSIGMGVPLLLIGASAGSLLPKTGSWMNAVRNFFGVIMLAMAVWILSPVIPKVLQMVLWASLLIVPAIYMHALDALPQHAHHWAKFWKGVAIMMLIYGICILVGAASGATSPLQPLSQLSLKTTSQHSQGLNFKRIKTIAELDNTIAAAKGKPVMLDFYADWCVACKEMEAETFTDAQVQSALKDTLLLQADVTQNTAEDTALLKRFGLYGPPGILFFDTNGQQLQALKVIGFQNASQFLTTLNKR